MRQRPQLLLWPNRPNFTTRTAVTDRRYSRLWKRRSVTADIRLVSTLFEQRPTRRFERRVRNLKSRVRILLSRIVHSLHRQANRGVLRLCCGNVHGRADSDQRKKFRRSLAFQSNTTVRTGRRMHKALMKPVSRRELAPVTHWVADVMTAGMASCRGHDAISLHAKAILAGALVLLFGVNREICRIRAYWIRRRGVLSTLHVRLLFCREDCQKGDFDGEGFVNVATEMIAQFFKITDPLRFQRG